MKKDKKNIQDKIKNNENLENIDKKNEESIDNNLKKNEDNTDTVDENITTNEKEEESLKEEIRMLKEERIRALAEMENLRKRFEREKIDSIKYGSVNLARDILSPGDNLERALSAVNKEEDHPKSIKNLIEGLLMVKKEISTALEKNGITKIDTLNKKFDPNIHQAMMEVENNELDEGIVVQEIQTGYMMHDRLLRPAMVGVSKKSKKDFNEDSESGEEDSKKEPQN